MAKWKIIDRATTYKRYVAILSLKNCEYEFIYFNDDELDGVVEKINKRDDIFNETFCELKDIDYEGDN